jgi:hypothetical protein
MSRPQELPGIHCELGPESVEPRKSPGCLRVPGLFFLLSEVRVSFERFHGFTANRRRSQAGREWVGISGLIHARPSCPGLSLHPYPGRRQTQRRFSAKPNRAFATHPPLEDTAILEESVAAPLFSANGISLPGTPNAFVSAVSQACRPAIVS